MIENPLLLHIETATDVCSVALTRGDEVLGVAEEKGANSHAKKLLPFIDDVLKANSCNVNNLNAVVVSIGPGSYTGLRIGISTAKGIAYTANIPVISVGTLTGIAQGAKSAFKSDIQPLIVPMIDARRMEVFTQIFNFDMSVVENVSAKIVDNDTFSAILSANDVVFCGNGMPKCRELLSSNNRAYFSDIQVSAANLLPAALAKWNVSDFENTAYFEPFYLKEYVAAKPNVKGLR